MSFCVLGKCNSPETRESYTVGENLPSRQYLPSFVNPLQTSKLSIGGSDIETVLENNLEVIPLARDHDRQNGFQYQPIISHQYSTGSTESPRYSNSAVANLPQNWNTRILGSPINNANEVKPITKSHLSQGTVAYGYRSTPEGYNPNQYPSTPCLTPRFQTRYGISPLDQTTANYSPIRKILTVNDQEDNTHRGRLTLQLTPPRIYPGIPRHRIDNVSAFPNSSRKFVAPGPRSRGRPLIDHRDIKPVSEGNDDEANHDYHNAGGYQLGNRNDVLKLLLNHLQGYDRGFNTQQHPPPDPILALMLSHYGQYLPGLRTPRLYGYMAVNNIHNNKPFGSYKLTRDYDG